MNCTINYPLPRGYGFPSDGQFFFMEMWSRFHDSMRGAPVRGSMSWAS